jgi:putative nucleotidyltransferase with HDIG domain
MVAHLIKSDAGPHQEDDLKKFWQRYFDYARQDPALPKKSFQLRSPAGTYENHNQTISPFTERDGIFALDTLPIPTPLLAKALTLQARGELTEEILLDFFCCDPVLMAMAIKLLNGSATGDSRSRQISRRQQIIEQLGPEVLKTLLHTAAMQRGLQKQSSMETAKVSTDFWAHSCTCAFLAENIAEITAYPFPEEAFIAGLIHDIGRLALQTGYPAVYGRFSENFGHDTALLEMERRIFKMDHAEIAAKALRSWQLDSLLVDAVQYHTESSSRILQAFSLVRIVSLACRMPSSPAGELETDTLGQVLGGLFAEKRQGLITNANEKTRQLAARLNIPFPADRDDSKRAATESHFRQQARECALLQSALPGTSAGTTLPEIIRMVFSACDILLCIRPAFCLMPDHQLAVLKALWHPGYPQSPGYADGKTPGDIEFSLQWEKSHVVQAFLYGELKIVTKEDKDELPLADQQLFHLLKTDKFICMPMIAKERNRGIIVFGLQKNQHTKIDSLRKQLEQFGVQAAKIFTCLPE